MPSRKVKFLLLLAAAGFVPALAADPDPLGPILNPLEYLKPASAECCTAPEPEPTLETLKNVDFTECLEAVCGKPEKLTARLTGTDERIGKEAQTLRPEIEKTFRPLLEKWATEKLAKERRELAKLEVLLEKGPFPTLPAVRNYLTMVLTNGLLGGIKFDEEKIKTDTEKKAQEGTFDWNQFDIVPYIDGVKTLNYLRSKGLSQSEAASVLEYGKTLFRSMNGVIAAIAKSSGAPELFLILQEKTSFREAVLKRAATLERLVTQTQEELESLFNIKFPPEQALQLTENARLTREVMASSSGIPLYVLNDLIDTTATFDDGMKTFKTMVSGKNLPVGFSPLNGDWIKRFKIKETFAARIAPIRSDAEAKKLSDAVIESCLSTLSRTAASYIPHEEYLKITGQLRERLNGEFSQAVKSWLSETTSGKWIAQYEKPEFIFPPSRQDWLKLALNSIQSNYKTDVMNDDAFYTQNPDLRWFNVAKFADINIKTAEEKKAAAAKGELDNELFFHDIAEACNGHRIEPALRDYAYPPSQTILVSWSTLKEPQSGPGIALHERGHTLEIFLNSEQVSFESSQKYNRLAKCLAGRHVENDLRRKVVSLARPFYHTEDFGDWVTGSLAKDPLSMGCALTSRDGTGKYAGWTGDKDKPWDKPRIINLSESDTHSSDVFRPLHMHWMKHGKFPDACVTALQKARYPTDWGKCEFK